MTKLREVDLCVMWPASLSGEPGQPDNELVAEQHRRLREQGYIFLDWGDCYSLSDAGEELIEMLYGKIQ